MTLDERRPTAGDDTFFVVVVVDEATGILYLVYFAAPTIQF